MKQIISKAKKTLEDFLVLDPSVHDQFDNLDALIFNLNDQLQTAQSMFLTLDTPTTEQEICFFKNIKCKILAYIHFLNYLKDIELRKPSKKSNNLLKFYAAELAAVKKKIKNADYYYSYFKSKATHSDHQYFIRLKMDILRSYGDTLMEINKHNNTPYVPIFAKIEAYDLLLNYLSDRIKAYTKSPVAKNILNNKLSWTASKSDLIELLYALHASGVFNNGQADLKDIAETLQQAFNVNLGQYNRVFLDIRARKKNQTKFINTLRDCLNTKIKVTENELV